MPHVLLITTTDVSYYHNTGHIAIMPKSLSKVYKKINKKKKNINSLHENSRDAQTLRRASFRDGKLAKLASARAKINQHHRK